MIRRIHIRSSLKPDELIALDPDQAHHLRDVLRITEGAEVELFDDAGTTAQAIVTQSSPAGVIVRIDSITPKATTALQWTIASAIPKAARADWMIEKLSELGTAHFIPLSTARSVVHPKGENKFDRWTRIASESAKQSRRQGVMQIRPLTSLDRFLPTITAPAFHLSTAPDARPLSSILYPLSSPPTFLIGPEGGWTPDEEQLLIRANLTPLTLGPTILRVETAAVAIAAIAACLLATKEIR